MSCNIIVTPEFSRSLKKLAKHYKSMKDDFASLISFEKILGWERI